MPPTVSVNKDGRLELFARGMDDNAWHIWQTSPGGAWSSWTNLGGIGAGDPLALANADGRLELFAINAAGNCWHTWQTTPGGGWSPLANLGGVPGAGLDTPLSGALDAAGCIRLFALDKTGLCQTTKQTAPGSTWTGWSDLLQPTAGNAISAPPAAILRSGINHPGLTALAMAPGLPVSINEADGVWDGHWTPVGAAGVGKPSLSEDPHYKGAALLQYFTTTYAYVVDDNGSLWQAELNVDGQWDAWRFITGMPTMAGPPVANGRTVAVRGADQQAYCGVSSGPPGVPGFGAIGGIGSGNPALARNHDGRLELFAVNASGNCWHAWEQTPGGTWAAFANLGNPGPTKLVSD
jgi:hypothetical protein